MTELEEKIYQHFQTQAQYIYSADLTTKSAEVCAVKALENDCRIIVKTKTIGYVIAEVI